MKTITQTLAVLTALGAGLAAASAQAVDAVADAAAEVAAEAAATQLDAVTVSGDRVGTAVRNFPASSASVNAARIADTVNLVNTEDALRYLPSLLVRKRYIGDTNAPVATRTTGINASARSLIYADGLLLSTLINNNNGNGSPQWFLVAPGEIDHVDVLYGPYSAAYPGNSYGAVVDLTTRMPKGFEADGGVVGNQQYFKQYGTDETYTGYQLHAGVGDRRGRFSWRLGLNHLDSDSQPVTYLTLTQSRTAATTQPQVTGAYADLNRTGAAIQVIGAGNLTHTLQDTATLKLAYELDAATAVRYTLGYWQNTADTLPDAYIRDSAGNAYYGASSGQVNIGGYAYSASTIAAQYAAGRVEQQRLAQALSLTHDGADALDWSIRLSDFNYLRDRTLASTGVFPQAQFGGAGRVTNADGTGWSTADAELTWKPAAVPDTQLRFGVHGDQYTLDTPTYSNSTNWRDGTAGALFSDSRGKTRTGALWLEDQWQANAAVSVSTGLRYEVWRAYDGYNSNLITATGKQSTPPQQPGVRVAGVSPKLSATWTLTPQWALRGSAGRALRFPTVGELYQNVATGATFTKPNPYLKPEDVLSTELAAEYRIRKASLRLAVFQEQVKDALIGQTSNLPGVAAPVSFTQNVDRTRQRGIELAGESHDWLLEGLNLQGNLTYVDAHILRNDSYVPTIAGAQSVGRRTPYVPLWRATLAGTYHFTPSLAWTLAGRYSARQYATVDNTDINPHTYQGFEGYCVADTRLSWQLLPAWRIAAGINNLNNRRYFLFHPFEQRTAFAELSVKF